jgi:hypothetical protein
MKISIKQKFLEMKNLYRAIFCLSLIPFFVACSDDFIDLYPLDQANVGNSFVTADDANLAVMGVYAALQGGDYPRDMSMLTENIADNSYPQGHRLSANGSQDIRELTYFLFTDQNGLMRSTWTRSYRGISRANMLLGRIGNIPFNDEDLKEQYIGEAKFLRATFYFDLVRFFGGVPVSLSEIESAEQAFALGRETEEKLYEAIIRDLQEAADQLPVFYNDANLGRATEGAAKALLAKVYLTTGEYSEAADLLRQLTTAPYNYSLMDTYADVFDDDNTRESIFEIQYTSSAPGEGNPYVDFFLPEDNTAPAEIFGPDYQGQGGRGWSLVTDDLYEAYEEGDERRDYTIDQYNSGMEGRMVHIVRKYREAPTSPNNSEDNIILLRYADVLLMLAETINEENQGPTNEAYDAVDQVRLRAGLDIWERDMNYETLRQALLEERRKEFAFENHRWFDLKRFGEAVNILSDKGYAIQPHNLLFPISRSEIEINPKIEQNPGYN